MPFSGAYAMSGGVSPWREIDDTPHAQGFLRGLWGFEAHVVQFTPVGYLLNECLRDFAGIITPRRIALVPRPLLAQVGDPVSRQEVQGGLALPELSLRREVHCPSPHLGDSFKLAGRPEDCREVCRRFLFVGHSVTPGVQTIHSPSASSLPLLQKV